MTVLSGKPRMWLCMNDMQSYEATMAGADQTVNLYMNEEDRSYNAATSVVSARPRCALKCAGGSWSIPNTAGSKNVAGDSGYFVVPQGTTGVTVHMRGKMRYAHVSTGMAYPVGYKGHGGFLSNFTATIQLIDIDGNIVASMSLPSHYTYTVDEIRYGNVELTSDAAYSWEQSMICNGDLAPDGAKAFKLHFYWTVNVTDYYMESPSGRIIIFFIKEGTGDYNFKDNEESAHLYQVSWDDVIVTAPSLVEAEGEVNYAIMEDYEENS